MIEDTIYVTYYYKKIKENIKIAKVDGDTNKQLQGVTFKIEKLNNNGDIDSSFKAVEKMQIY